MARIGSAELAERDAAEERGRVAMAAAVAAWERKLRRFMALKKVERLVPKPLV
jgi:hypothetical protein